MLAWYAKFGRKTLPWNITRDPYRVWLSEIMLQQTQVATVIPYFERFLNTFPSLEALSKAKTEHVLQHWAGLGYYARARNLHRAAQMIASDFKGKFPSDVADLVKLPGIGLSTAGAIAAQAFARRAPILDGNVKRVLSRFHCITGQPQNAQVLETLWALSDYYTPHHDVADYTQAIMDIGATLCTRSRPQCTECPLKTHCLAYQQDDPLKYPEKKPKKTIPTRKITMIVLQNHLHACLLVERPSQGIWGGLWSLPEFENLDNAKTFVKKLLGVAPKHYQPLPIIEHAFSHYRLHIHPFTVVSSIKVKRLPKKHQWHTAEQLKKIGLPAPITKILKAQYEDYII